MSRCAAAILTLLLSGGLASLAPAEESIVYGCQQSNGTLFFTDDPKHFPANCQPMEGEAGDGGLILLLPDSTPKDREQLAPPSRPWRIDDWRLQSGERTSS
jgi:hypothetical protein